MTFTDGQSTGELMTNLVINSGWTEVLLAASREKIIEQRSWCEENCAGAFIGEHGRWVFKLSSDATQFVLFWS